MKWRRALRGPSGPVAAKPIVRPFCEFLLNAFLVADREALRREIRSRSQFVSKRPSVKATHLAH